MKMIDIEKDIVNTIEEISEFGKTNEGGISRVLYSEEWVKVQNRLKAIIEEKGFTASFDQVGNLFGRLEGSRYKDETILTGSHVDTVVNGGKLDGQLGIVAGIVAMEFLKTNYGTPVRNLEVVSMAEEEGSRFPFTFWGSKNIVGTVDKEVVEGLKDINGIGFTEAMTGAGFHYKDSKDDVRKDIKAFLELHIEQGGVLEMEKKSIGIVEHIVGQKRFMIQVMGEANHAGTTPMGYRKDALYGSSKMITEIMDLATEYGDPLVATVGKLDVSPNTTNVVPGKVVFSLDVRHTQGHVMVKFIEEVGARLHALAQEMSLSISIDKYMDGEPVPMDSRLVEVITEQCREKGLNYKRMHSGAGHDAQIFAGIVPTAMIFVPSRKGISHNPAEYTEASDLAEGVKALIETLYRLAYLD